MKKIILGVAVAGLAMSYQKIQAGGNQGVLRTEDGVERYSDDVMKDATPTETKKVEEQAVGGMMTEGSDNEGTQPVQSDVLDSAAQEKQQPASTEPAK
ncbi:MAG TPA: hypothetical protein DCW95_04880 [Chryseobacterium sp.]|nr:hypothetical protein [Chryseobacterium sp.]